MSKAKAAQIHSALGLFSEGAIRAEVRHQEHQNQQSLSFSFCFFFFFLQCNVAKRASLHYALIKLKKRPHSSFKWQVVVFNIYFLGDAAWKKLSITQACKNMEKKTEV